jgi:hypothetical protein
MNKYINNISNVKQIDIIINGTLEFNQNIITQTINNIKKHHKIYYGIKKKAKIYYPTYDLYSISIFIYIKNVSIVLIFIHNLNDDIKETLSSISCMSHHKIYAIKNSNNEFNIFCHVDSLKTTQNKISYFNSNYDIVFNNHVFYPTSNMNKSYVSEQLKELTFTMYDTIDDLFNKFNTARYNNY